MCVGRYEGFEDARSLWRLEVGVIGARIGARLSGLPGRAARLAKAGELDGDRRLIDLV